MKRFKKYAGVLLAILLCVTMSLVGSLSASADLVIGSASDFTVDEPGDDPVDTPSEEGTPSEDETDTPPDDTDDTPSQDGYVDVEDPFGTTESTDTESTESQDTESDESDENDADESTDGETTYEEESSYDEDADENENYGSATYYPGNGEDITGNAGSGSDEWGADYSEGTVVSKSGGTSKKNIADYHGKMLGLIWIPIVLIVLAAGTLIVTNVYFSKKKGKNGGAKPTRKK